MKIKVTKLSYDEVLEMIKNGEIKDSKTVHAISLYKIKYDK